MPPNVWDLHPTKVSGVASITRVIEDGIKRPIQLLVENHCLPAALILTYSGIEMMASLNMSSDRLDVTRSDFIDWADKYMVSYLPETGYGRRVTGKDLYGARCSALRGADSRLAREGHCRLIRYGKTDNERAITMRVEEFVSAFFHAIDIFVAEALIDETRATTITNRLDQMLKALPF